MRDLFLVKFCSRSVFLCYSSFYAYICVLYTFSLHISSQDLDSEEETDFFKNEFNDTKTEEVSFRFILKHGEWTLSFFVETDKSFKSIISKGHNVG